MLIIEKLIIKNYMSFGNVPTTVEFDSKMLNLVIGSNKDVSDDGDFTESRNGTGKSSILSALSYALYDLPIGNIRKDNLVNNINGKNMEVEVFYKNKGNSYHILRGRKPSVLKFYINDTMYDEAQGENRDTQAQIEGSIGFSHDLFQCLVALTIQSGYFLKKKQHEQRPIIEELLGVTQLSQKAAVLKELIGETKKKIDQENFKISTLENINKKTLDQISKMTRQSEKWITEHEDNLTNLTATINELKKLDIKAEIEKHEINKNFLEYDRQNATYSKQISGLKKDIENLSIELVKITKNYKLATQEKVCYACGHSLDNHSKDVISEISRTYSDKQAEINTKIQELERITILQSSLIPVERQITFYEEMKDAWDHETTLNYVDKELEKEQSKENPFLAQLVDLKNETLQEIDYNVLEALKTDLNHQEFLHKILTSKDSFVRKKIIDQSLPFLNNRLEKYLDNTGLPHKVKFQSDLSVTIDLMGREFDFDNLSQGQKTRLSLSLSLAFIDVFESLNFPINLIYIDEILDTGLDPVGINNAVKIFKSMSRINKKTVFLVSHRDEIKARAENIVTVVMENGFSKLD